MYHNYTIIPVFVAKNKMAIVQLIALTVGILAFSHSSEKNAVTSTSSNPPLRKEPAIEKMRLELAPSQLNRGTPWLNESDCEKVSKHTKDSILQCPSAEQQLCVSVLLFCQEANGWCV